ncbi:GGDEF domain-containing protein [Pseudonocardia parietis]|uniref:Diguanylate cyclase (GGDEF)-like protein n=1 Tax=Pseudonocardia parietis TaxID=570936 RepID=A0ABS4VY40_9PSEU|nr:GGDEF domain-containing protein [Pseudonocardia parietis]MBP2368863.1 diguanylate cyclase (GGDEF)-like protein [Pseudonocardia parietis]
MTSQQAVPRPASRRRWAPSSWSIRTVPARALVFVLLVEAATVALLVLDAVHWRAPTSDQLVVTGLLVLVAAAHTELSLNAERLRRRIAETRFVNMTSVWTFAAALLLPPLPATAVVAGVYLHLYLRVSREAGVPPHRHLFSTATMVLAVHAAAGVRLLAPDRAGTAFSPHDAGVVLGALLAFTLVNTLLIVSVLRLARPGSRFLRILLGGEILLELATLSLGGLVAVIVGNTTPWLVLLAILPLLVLEQTTLVRQLEAQADTDAKTGLLNPVAWRRRTRQMLERSRRTGRATAVLILDLDHFKAVNDRHGHLAGDDVLQAVARVLTEEVRDHDLAGRFGGEEFVVALGGLRPDDVVSGRACDVAERIRRRVGSLAVDTRTAGRVSALSVSVGVAASPDHGDDVDALLAAADTALYEAKHGGRNRIRVRPAEHRAEPAETATPPLGLRFGT